MERKSIMADHQKAATQKKKGGTVIAPTSQMTRTRQIIDKAGNVIEEKVIKPKQQ